MYWSSGGVFSQPSGKLIPGMGQARQTTASSPAFVPATPDGSWQRPARLSILICRHSRTDKVNPLKRFCMQNNISSSILKYIVYKPLLEAFADQNYPSHSANFDRSDKQTIFLAGWEDGIRIVPQTSNTSEGREKSRATTLHAIIVDDAHGAPHCSHKSQHRRDGCRLCELRRSLYVPDS